MYFYACDNTLPLTTLLFQTFLEFRQPQYYKFHDQETIYSIGPLQLIRSLVFPPFGKDILEYHNGPKLLQRKQVLFAF